MSRLTVSDYKFHYENRLFKAPPKLVTFDAYNTIYLTRIPVLETYCKVGEKYGVKSDLNTMLHNFPRIFKELNVQHPIYGKTTNITPNEWWSTLIKNCFSPEPVSDTMVDEILDMFKGKQAYTVYPDLVPFLEKLQKDGCVIAVVSNTDPVMYELIENLGLGGFFKDNIYLSYDIGVKKPNPLIFDHVLEQVVKKHPKILEGTTKEELKENYCYHIGDELENDMNGATQAGWNAILVDRPNNYGYFTNAATESNGALNESALATDKINKHYETVLALSSAIDDVAITENKRQLFVPNLRVLMSLFV